METQENRDYLSCVLNLAISTSTCTGRDMEPFLFLANSMMWLNTVLFAKGKFCRDGKSSSRTAFTGSALCVLRTVVADSSNGNVVNGNV